jgi:hypothetical protein
MVLWHMGVGALLTYVTLGRRRIDYRYVLAGAVAPDVLDAALDAAGVNTAGGRGPAHSLLAVVVVGVTVVLAFSRPARLRAFGLAVGWLTHLVADGMWEAPEIFLWPAFGMTFEAPVGEPYAWDLLAHPFDHLSTWLAELVGVAILAWFWVAHRLGEEGRFRSFLGDGYLRP